uniref:Expansin-like EG45 domain-containing protein n=1 Tax=Aegilops tauschii subsp. strangulata TaxID=200361 RepID=A0A453JA23_AEGTS
MGKPQPTLLGVAAPPVVLAVLLLSCSLHGARAEEESASLDTGVVRGEAGLLNSSAVSIGQSGVARATWYGAPNGAGPYDNGGACGFKNVNRYPFMAMTSCGNQPLFKDGKGCGACYKVLLLYLLHSTPLVSLAGVISRLLNRPWMLSAIDRTRVKVSRVVGRLAHPHFTLFDRGRATARRAPPARAPAPAPFAWHGSPCSATHQCSEIFSRPISTYYY